MIVRELFILADVMLKLDDLAQEEDSSADLLVNHADEWAIEVENGRGGRHADTYGSSGSGCGAEFIDFDGGFMLDSGDEELFRRCGNSGELSRIWIKRSYHS